MGVYDHAGCKEHCKYFTVALKIFSVFNKKQMCDSLFTGKEIAYIYFIYLFVCL